MNLHLYAFTAILLAAIPAVAQVDSDAFSMKLIDTFKITGRGTILTGQIGSGEVGGW